MPWVKSDDDEFEYRTLEWRAFQDDDVRGHCQINLVAHLKPFRVNR